MKSISDKNFKVGDFVTFYGCTDGIPHGGISLGEIIQINGDYGRVVTGGIELNRLKHYQPNYMIPIRYRPMNDTDSVYRVTMSTLSNIEDTKWGM